MKKIIKFLLFVLVLVNLAILISGKTWLYKAVSVTYLKGYNSAYIDDFIHFESNDVKAGEKHNWLVSKSYNKTVLPKNLVDLHSDNQSVAFLVIINDSIFLKNTGMDILPKVCPTRFRWLRVGLQH